MKLNFEAIAARVSPDEIISKIIGEARQRRARCSRSEQVPLPAAALAADTPDHVPTEAEKAEGKKKRRPVSGENNESLLLERCVFQPPGDVGTQSSSTDLSGYFGGKHLVKTYGQTVEFADYREYQLGDDIRRIDWNLYSRFEKYFP